LIREACRLIAVRSQEAGSEGVGLEYRPDSRIAEAVNFLTGFWVEYTSQKQSLPSDCGWYWDRPKHQDRLVTEDAQTSVALATHTRMQSKSEADYVWVERILSRIVLGLFERRRLAERAVYLGRVPDITRFLASQGLFAESRIWIKTLREAGWKNVNGELANGPDAEVHNLVDIGGLSMVNFILGLGDYCRNRLTDFPDWIVEACRTSVPSGLGRETRSAVDRMRDSLAFEQSVEATSMAPNTCWSNLWLVGWPRK
jgi:hypothetical protein